jgi:ATP-dependent DNA helicase PIF1
LRLKQGAQVMTLKNDSGKRYVNGSLGVVKTLEPELKISVNNHTITMEKETWEEVDYKLRDDGEIVTEKKNSFTQYPLSLAYAMTIHKSQGKSFNRVTVDIGNGAFAPGQVYVALSRSTSLEGLVLNNPIQDKDIFVDERVVAYYRTKQIPPSTYSPETEHRAVDVLDTIRHAAASGQPVKIAYANYQGKESQRVISQIRFTTEHSKVNKEEHIKAYCHLSKEELAFKLARIRRAESAGVSSPGFLFFYPARILGNWSLVAENL